MNGGGGLSDKGKNIAVSSNFDVGPLNQAVQDVNIDVGQEGGWEVISKKNKNRATRAVDLSEQWDFKIDPNILDADFSSLTHEQKKEWVTAAVILRGLPRLSKISKRIRKKSGVSKDKFSHLTEEEIRRIMGDLDLEESVGQQEVARIGYENEQESAADNSI